MPARIEVRTPAGHSLALFSEGHMARNKVDRALALTADPGAAGDVHRFRLSMRRKQELFTRMRDLDIAWNDWLAEAEGIDSRLRASNITSHSTYTTLLNPGLTIADSEPTWIIWMDSRRYPSRLGPGKLSRHAILPWNSPYYTTKNVEVRSASTVKITTQHSSAHGPTSNARTPRTAAFRSVIRVSTICAWLESYRLLARYPTTDLTQYISPD
ncbi:hypothetical protein EDB87DRAFT_1581922 [Lactarius vividus]|nr:hypothetical protein EDB87DRAFT_1581922 [Lactarius vividus]